MKKAEVYSTTRLTESYWPATSEKTLLGWSIGQALRAAASEAPDCWISILRSSSALAVLIFKRVSW